MKTERTREQVCELLALPDMRDPRDALGLAMRASLLAQVDRCDEAAIDLRAALALEDRVDFLVALASIEMLRGELGEAECLLQRAIMREKTTENVLFLGQVFLFQEKYEDALVAYETAIALAPEDTDVLFAVVKMLVNTERAEADEKIARLAAFEGQTYRVCLYRGLALCQHGRFQEALADLDRAIQLAPNDLRAYRARRRALCVLAKEARDRGEVLAAENYDRRASDDLVRMLIMESLGLDIE